MILIIIISIVLIVVVGYYFYVRHVYKNNGALKGFAKFYYNVVKALKEPYLVLFKEKHRLAVFLWFLFTIFAAQIGTIVNLIKHVLFTEQGSANKDWLTLVQESLYMDSQSGSFYTFSIVLTASVLSPLFIKLVEYDVHFRKLKVLSIVLSIFTLFFGGIFYSFSTLDNRNYSKLANSEFFVDKWQLLFFVVAILIALYSYGLTRMDLDPKSHTELDDYPGTEKAEMDKIKKNPVTNTEGGLQV